MTYLAVHHTGTILFLAINLVYFVYRVAKG